MWQLRRPTLKCFMILVLVYSSAHALFVLFSSSVFAGHVEETTIHPNGNTGDRMILNASCFVDGGKDGRLLRETNKILQSVRSELQLLEDLRRELLTEINQNKEKLAQLQNQHSKARKSTSSVESVLDRRPLLSTRSGEDGTGDVSPIFILPASNSPCPQPERPAPGHASRSQRGHCSLRTCWDFTLCSLLKESSVFLPQLQSTPPSNSPVEDISKHLDAQGILANSSEDACVNLFVLSDTEHCVVPNQSHNNMVVDLSLGRLPEMLAVSSNAVVASSMFSTDTFREDHDVVIPPLLYNFSTGSYWMELPPVLPTKRKLLLFFQGVWSGEDSHPLSSSLLLLKEKALYVDISIDCESTSSPQLQEGWKLCGNSHSRSHGYRDAIFSLIIMGTSPQPYSLIRLVESLRWGSVPVIVLQKELFLPFSEILEWKEVAVVVPHGRFNEIHYILRRHTRTQIMEYKRRGRFIFETYFRSAEAIIDGVMAVLHHRLLFPLPHPPEYKGQLLFSTQPTEHVNATPAGVGLISSHHIYNLPPGPRFPPPHTLYMPPPVSGHQYEGLSLDVMPNHVLKGGGVTGPDFPYLLLGNRPVEYFTVVILTYKRTRILTKLLFSLRALSYVDKFLIVWNNPEDPPPPTHWPTLPAPLEVVRCDRNSLNNRFLPFANIRTDAVFSLDDDVSITTEEIEITFRVWRENRDRIVGLPGRFHLWDPHHNMWGYNSNYTCEISMVLTGAAFIHKYYLYVYTYWMSEDIRRFVDQLTNCEDIAMNFLVAHITRKPPIKVTTRWTFRCPSCGKHLSDDSRHMIRRSQCVDHLASVYGYMPLLYSQWRADSILFKTRVPTQMGKCYLYV